VTRLADEAAWRDGYPSDRHRRGQPGGDMKTTALRGTAVTARVGSRGCRGRGVLVTGLISHFIQPAAVFFWPPGRCGYTE